MKMGVCGDELKKNKRPRLHLILASAQQHLLKENVQGGVRGETNRLGYLAGIVTRPTL